MPIPFLLIGVAAVTAAAGIGAGVKAGVDQKDADDTNRRASSIAESATERANKSRENSKKAIEALGSKKIWILDHSVESFIHHFERIHNIELGDSPGMDELRKFYSDKQSFDELKQLSGMASSIASGLVGGAAAGVLAAFGAYGGAMTLGVASTGTAIAGLSGVAATNATLAFLGGGALSVGGLGMAGGAMVLGGLVAGPALAVLGFVVGAKASANKDEAYSNLAQAKAYREQVDTLEVLSKAIRMRANMFERLLIKLDAIFTPLTLELEDLIEKSGTDFAKYTQKERELVAANLTVVKAIKSVLDTPILTEDGNLTKESAEIEAPIQNVIDAHAHS